MKNRFGCQKPMLEAFFGRSMVSRAVAALLLTAGCAASGVAHPKTPANDEAAATDKAAPVEKTPSAEKSHPLDPALKIAREGLEHIKSDVRDYTCTIIKRERVNDQLGDYQFMSAKIRHQQEKDGKIEIPFSVYLKFLKPKNVEGREVIWIAGRNDGKFVVHEAGLLNFKRVWLLPTSGLAMMGQRYPITEIGVQNLVIQLITKAERDRKHDEIEVKFFDNSKVNDRTCRMIQVVHPEKRDHFDFHKAQIFIDVELNVPIRYAAWSWPAKPGDELPLLEEYTYVDMKLNVGLTDKDFDPSNDEYNFPSF